MRLINITTNIRKRRNRTQNISNRALYDIQIFLWAAVREKKRRVCVWDDRDRWGNTHTSQVGWKFQPRSKTKKSGCKEQKNIYIYIRPATKAIQSQQLKKEGVVASATRPIQAALWEVQTSLSLSFFLLCVWERWRKRSHSPNRQKEERRKTRFLWHKQKCLLSLRCVCYFSRRWPIPTRRKWNLRKQQ